MTKILTIIGARPQFIKAAALSRTIKQKFAQEIEEKILHTGQHYDSAMSDIFFQELDIPRPHFLLHSGSGSHGEQTSKMIADIEKILLSEQFNAVILYGDTNSTLSGAIAASKLHIPIVHIEAGLRSFNMCMPEEINRIICDQLSCILFAPTETAIQNLKQEGFFSSKQTFANGRHRHIYNSGDIMYDNTLYFSHKTERLSSIMEQLGIEDGNYILATIHRANNTDDIQRLTSIFHAFHEISSVSGKKIILPLHPRTEKMLHTSGLEKRHENIFSNNKIVLIPPVSFLDMMQLEQHAQIIMTDSGGVQKEAYFLQKPCVVLRPETEWTEIIEQKAGILADADTDRIVSAYTTLTDKKLTFPPVFGNGHTAEFILERLQELL